MESKVLLATLKTYFEIYDHNNLYKSWEMFLSKFIKYKTLYLNPYPK